MNYASYERVDREANYHYKKILDNPFFDTIFTFEGVNLFKCLDYKLYHYLLKFFSTQEHINKTPFNSINKNSFSGGLFTSPLQDNLSLFFKRALEEKRLPAAVTKKQGNFEKLKLKIWTNYYYFYKCFIIRNHSDVIFVLPAQHSVKLFPLFKELNKKKIKYSLVLHDLDLKTLVLLYTNFIPFIERRALMSKSDHLIRKPLKRMQSMWNKSRDKFRVIESREYKQTVLRDALILGINFFLKGELSQIARDVLATKFIITNFKPKLIVTTTDPDTKVLPYIYKAKETGIKTITLQHGAYASCVNVDFKSDTNLVWGNYYMNWFKEKLGKKSNQFVITGSTFYDNFRLKKLKKINKQLKELSVLILLENVYFLKEKFETELKKIIGYVLSEGIQKIYIRPHPWQDISFITNAFKNSFEVSIIIDNSNNLNRSINKNDLVITMDTSAGFNALILGKKLIYWDFFGKENLPFRMGGVPVAKSPEEIRDFMIKIINNKFKSFEGKRKKLLKDIFYKLDGRSSQRVVNFLESELRR